MAPNLRSYSSLPNVLLTSLNLLLFLLSSTSFAPLLLLRTPPAPFGWALFAVSLATLLSSLVGFYSHLTHHRAFFVIHISLVVVASSGQALGCFSLLLRPDPSLRFLESARDAREVRVLLRIEEALMAVMFVASSAVLVLECMVQSWWLREYEEVEAAASAKKRSRNRRTARVQVELAGEVVKEAAEADARKTDERMKSPCQQSMEN